MAGSLSHIVADDDTFTIDYVETGGDKHEALEECHQVIAYALQHGAPSLAEIMDALGYPMPAANPKLQPELWGSQATLRHKAFDPQVAAARAAILRMLNGGAPYMLASNMGFTYSMPGFTAALDALVRQGMVEGVFPEAKQGDSGRQFWRLTAKALSSPARNGH